MASLSDFKLFENHCAGCGKSIPTPAINRRGDVATVFCNRACETRSNQEKRMVDHKPVVPFKKGLTTEQLTQRMSTSPWSQNHGGQYVTANQIISEDVPI